MRVTPAPPLANERLLSAKEAKVELVSRPTIAANTVIDQDPVPGTRLGVGSEVKLKVVMAGSPAKEV